MAGMLSAVGVELFETFLAIVELLVSRWIVERCCCGLAWSKHFLAAQARPTVVADDASYRFVALLTDSIMERSMLLCS